MAENKNGKVAKVRKAHKHTRSHGLRHLSGYGGFLDTVERRLSNKQFGLRSWAALDYAIKHAPGLLSNITLPPQAVAYARRCGYAAS